MTSPAEVIATPKGGGALQGIGEKFSPDLYTGTGNFTIPVALPPGRNGFNPQLSLVYSTGNGNGPFGLGWGLSVPGVSRKTSKGVPLYDDSKDVFILSGSEDLVAVGSPSPGTTQYRPRAEGLFARILHHRDSNNDFWEVKSKDGLTSFYGTPAQSGTDTAAIANPQDKSRVFAWKLTQTTDPFGNLIQYVYERDASQAEGIHHWDQLYLSSIRYVDFGDRLNPNFLVMVTFIYNGRPDHFSDYRPGFEIRTVRRCTKIQISTNAGAVTPVRTYHFDYADESISQDDLPLNGSSLLHRVRFEGHDGEISEWLPPLEFGYTQFRPELRKFMSIGGSLPSSSLADKNMELVDLFGCGLPDILEMNGTVRYWRNKGQGQFALPHQMDEAPAGVELSDAGVQILDADGNGTADLLVTTQTISGYYPLRFGGLWDKHSFQRYRVAPSFDLKDPEVHLVDLDGDGVTDAIRSSTRLECYFNDAEKGWIGSRWVERKRSLDIFPDVDFADPRVKWADMTGDGLQDIVLVHDGLVEYWPSLGRGNWARRIEMSGPRFPWGYDPKRILLGDVDGDGAADLVYVDDEEVTLWINQSGDGWSPPIKIKGTPPVSDLDSIRLVDLLGNGIAGVLWSKNASGSSRASSFFLDFTGGVKPYLLSEMNNHMGSVTHVEYKPSTWFYLQDQQRPETRWVTQLPFPVHVVTRVETVDSFSRGKLTTEYSYHHGYWDGTEREFRGFGRVDHRDTEVFSSASGVPPVHFSPPTETRTWFHQGAIGDRFDGWAESDSVPVPLQCENNNKKRFTDEYYKEPWRRDPPTAQVLSRPTAMADFISSLPLAVRRDAFRSLRGKVLRTELYALDGSEQQNRPYTVTEHVYGVREESAPSSADPQNRLHIFFPFALSERTTQWERGNDPLTLLKFTDYCDGAGKPLDYDSYGQMLSQINIAVPRGRDFQRKATAGESYLATQTATTYAQRDDNQIYMVDRVSSVTTYEVKNDGTATALGLAQNAQSGSAPVDVVSLDLTFYDGNPFQGSPLGHLDDYGALVRTESLVLTDAVLNQAYGTSPPPYLTSSGAPNWTSDYPQEFRNELPMLAGYIYQPGGPGSPYRPGYYRATDQRRYDFQEVHLPSQKGLVTARLDALGHETTLAYDSHELFPSTVSQVIPAQGGVAAGLVTRIAHDYRVFQPSLVTDPNGNQTQYMFSPLGLLKTIAVMGKGGENVGDRSPIPNTLPTPSSVFTHNFLDSKNTPLADIGQPISVRTTRRIHHINEMDVPEPLRSQTITTVEYSDGFGRLLQTRTQAEDSVFDCASSSGKAILGDVGLPSDQSQPGSDAVGRSLVDNPFVVVSGWQIYDNKGQAVEKYEPLFSTGWDYGGPSEAQVCQKLQKIKLYYDPRGRVPRIVNPDGSEQRVVYGVPGTIASPVLTDPDVFEPTPWEAYTYDADDNAGRTHPTSSASYQHCWNTPSSVEIDALGRTVRAIQRNRNRQSDGSWSPIAEYLTFSTYDIMGNLLTITDPSGRVAITSTYDLTKCALCTMSIDAGTRTNVLDAGGRVAEQRSGKGGVILRTYDELNRPSRMWARDAAGQTVTLRERIIYGDDNAGSGYSESQAAGLNLLGKPYKQYDEGGLLTFSTYDFKGNVLDKARNVIKESALLGPFNPPPANWVITPFRVDWSSGDMSFLDIATSYETTISYDALNRVKSMQYPSDVDGARKLLVPQYNRAGALENVQMDGATYVDRIAYNARGQRIFISYGNGLMTRYAYDTRTFRLLRMRTERYRKQGGWPLVYQPAAPAAPVQDFAYEYDLVGNILVITDRTPGSGIINNAESLQVQDPALAELLVVGDAMIREFVYDPIYRLISSTGRECDVPPPPPPWDDTPRRIDNTKTRLYTEQYQYDSVGNICSEKHTYVDSSGNSGGSTRQFTLVTGNNQLSQLAIGSTTYRYVHDSSGNLVRENTERHFEWDQSDRMRVFRVQPVSGAPSVYAQYLYDPAGRRVAKLVRDQSGGYEKTIYIDEFFEHQRIATSSGTIFENNSLHVMDSQKRVAIVRVGNPLPGDGTPGVKYHFGDHLGSSNVVVDDTGAWISREEYLPYGETGFGSFRRKRYRFTGKERDEESGLYYHGARYYAPWVCRWISVEPLRDRAAITKSYIYCNGRPIVQADPDGKNPILMGLLIGLFLLPNTANAPGPNDPKYHSMTESEFICQFALMYGTGALGGAVEKKLMTHIGESALGRTAAGAAGGAAGGLGWGGGTVLINDYFQGQLSPSGRYLKSMAMGLCLGVALGGIRGRLSGPPATLSDRAMLRFLIRVYNKTPVLQDLARVYELPAGQARMQALADVAGRFQAETGIQVEVVEPGAVQRATGQFGNYASLHSRPGYLQIERQVGEVEQGELLKEITHELSFYYTETFWRAQGGAGVPMIEPEQQYQLLHNGQGHRLLEDVVQNQGESKMLDPPR